MGRPSIISTGTHHHHHHHGEAASPGDSSTASETFPRRFPKLGNSYQIRSLPRVAAAEQYTSQRPVPERFSNDYPECTIEQVQQESAVLAQSVANASTTAVVLRGTTATGSSGSGNRSLLLSSGYGAAETILADPDVKSIVSEQPQPNNNNTEQDSAATTNNNNNTAATQWMHSVVQWQAIQLGAASATGRRRQIKKRPRTPTTYEDEQSNKRAKTALVAADLPLPPRTSSCQQQQLSQWVAWSGGRAVASRKAAARRGYVERFQQPSPTSSASWRNSSSIPVWGDYRRCKNAYVAGSSSSSSDADDDNNSAAAIVTTDDPVSVWKAVLACAQAVEGHLEQAASGASCSGLDATPSCETIYLSQLVRLVDYARCLPRPEDVFRGSGSSLQVEAIAVAFRHLQTVIQSAREHQAKLMDLWSKSGGMALETARQAVLESAKALAPIRLDEMDEYGRQIQQVTAWQRRLQTVQQQTDANQLAALQQLAQEAAASHGFVCTAAVQLSAKLVKVAQLQQRIREWLEPSSQRTETPKWIASLVRDVQRVQCHFAERVQLERIHEETTRWVDRATSAIRSRLSLEELQHLVATQASLQHTNVEEWSDKLQTRVAAAHEWLGQVAAVVGPVVDSTNTTGTAAAAVECNAAWMQAVRTALEDGHGAELHDLACQGGRLPVQVPAVQLVQVELEARTWKQKALRWIPDAAADGSSSSSSDAAAPATNNNGTIRRAVKLADLKEHVEKARALRDRLVLSDRDAWVLPGEAELTGLVEQAEDWLKTFHQVGDKSLSMSMLRQLAEQGRAIPVNLSPATTKVNKALQQAEEWYQQHADLLQRTTTGGGLVQVTELKAAVDAAEADLPIDLDEMLQLQQVLDKIETWQNTVDVATGNKPRTRGKKVALRVQDLERLIDEASSLPVDTQNDVASLQRLVQSVQNWQTVAVGRLQDIDAGLRDLRRSMDEAFGPPANYVRKRSESPDPETPAEAGPDAMQVDTTEPSEEKKVEACSTPGDSNCNKKAPSTPPYLSRSDSSVHGRIDAFCKEAAAMTIATPESEIAEMLVTVARWCSRSLKYLENQRDIFDRRFFGAFDRFYNEGKAMGSGGDKTSLPAATEILLRLRNTWVSVVDDQLQRLQIILSDRAEYIRFCKSTEAIISSEEKRPTLEKLKELTTKSYAFPGASDLVQKIRLMTQDSVSWAARAAEAMSNEKKMTMSEAKLLYDEGDKLGFQCDELKQLRNGLRTARGWANRVRRIKIEQGSTHVKDITALMDEHELLLVEMPEEMTKLGQATKNYCLCRRPYEGFMVGCDECGEWFHGPCIGVCESKADKFDKYVCVRCCIAKTFQSSATIVVGVVRKWTGDKDLKKARQIAAQKHQRRVRKETKTIEKLRKEESNLHEKLRQHHMSNGAGVAAAEKVAGPAPVVAPVGSGAGVVSAPPVASQTTSVNVTAPSGVPSSSLASGNTEKLPATSQENNATSMDVDEKGAKADAQEDDKLSSEEIVAKLSKIDGSIKACNARLAELAEKLVEQKRDQGLEDKNGLLLRKWCLRVRSMVLAPLSQEQAEASRPHGDGSFSSAMLGVIADAERFGLRQFEDVSIIVNAFACMGWTMRATCILARQPSLEDFESLVKEASKLDLPDEKGFRMMKTTLSRAGAWRNKVARILTPIPGESRPFDVEILRDLSHAGSDFPLYMPFESRLLTVIEDRGMRHCLCGGPSDGRFMLCCDKCDKWFHGHCVGISNKHSSDELEHWKCPCCLGCAVIPEKRDLVGFHDKFDAEHESDDEYDVSSKAPKPDEMWPPFGLFNSPKATEVLGQACCALPDLSGEWKVEDEPGLNPQGAKPAAESIAVPTQVQVVHSACVGNGATSVAIPATVSTGCPKFASGVVSSASSASTMTLTTNRDIRTDSISCAPSAAAARSEEETSTSTSLTSLVSKTSNSKEPSLVSSSDVMQLVACSKPTYNGLVAVQNTVNATNITSGGLPPVNPAGLLSVNAAAEPSVQREVLVASIQDTHCD